MKLLIANRGEIAVRIIRTCREQGIRSVAVYSEADKGSLHVKLADEAVFIGESEASKSYLCQDVILGAAREVGADAIHPGYGFLSERSTFSDACAEQGIVFIGPSGAAMRALGDKISAKKLAVSAGVPIVPGYFEPDAGFAEIRAAAERIGFPVMLKASAGGGGRGMRVVRQSEDLEPQFHTASAEALNAFGDGTMMVEKFVDRPRHVEVQILADGFGNVATLFERECSIQRRHQKLIEEAPSPLAGLPWEAIRDAARRVALAAGYTNAGTVEFIVDPVSLEFYFLEVNARLQVEHPVTEAITGLDLVAWQIKVALGESLSVPSGLLSGDRGAIQGHALEVRVIAEDPGKQFIPSVGKVLTWAPPLASVVRVDSGFEVGSEVSPYYDSLLAKVIVHGQTREESVLRMKAALLDFHILGVRTNISYLLSVLDHPEFVAGRIDTGFLEREFSGWSSGEADPLVGQISTFEQSASLGLMREQMVVTPASSSTDGFRNVRS